MRLVVSVVIDTERPDALAVYCNGRLVWPSRDWLTAAPCRGLPAELFVPDLDDTRARRAALADPPMAVGLLCGTCPYRRDCLSLGRINGSSGWWGGTLIHEGKALTAKGHVREPGGTPPPWTDRNRETRGAKITWDNVHEIRRRYDAGGVTQKTLGIEYGITLNSINRIVNRQSWVNQPKLSAADAETIRQRVAAGATHRVLAAEYGVSRWIIRGVVGEDFKRLPKLTLADEAEIRRRYAAGLAEDEDGVRTFGAVGVTYEQLAREYGVKKATIGTIIRAAGTAKRKRRT